MSEIITEMLYYMGSYIGLVGILIFVLNFLTKGLIVKFLRVKGSRGKKQLVKIRSATDTYFSMGEIKKGAFHFKTRSNDARLITNYEGKFYPFMSVFCIDTTEDGNVIEFVQDTAIQTKNSIDSAMADNMLNTAINAPQIADNLEKLKIGLLVVILVGVVILGFTLFNMSEQLTSVIQIVNQARVI